MYPAQQKRVQSSSHCKSSCSLQGLHAGSRGLRLRCEARGARPRSTCRRGGGRRQSRARSGGAGYWARRPPGGAAGHAVEHGVEDPGGIHAGQAVPLLAQLARPDLCPARAHAREEVVDAQRGRRLRALREQPRLPAPRQGPHLLLGLLPGCRVTVEPLAQGILRAQRLLVVPDVATRVDPREARVKALHDPALHNETASLEVDLLHPLLYVDAVTAVAGLRGHRVQGVAKGLHALHHPHVDALVAEAELHNALLITITGRPIALRWPSVAVIRILLCLQQPQGCQGFLCGLTRIQDDEALGHTRCGWHVELRHNGQTGQPFLAGQAPPELGVVRPARHDATCLHPCHHLEEGRGVHVRGRARKLVAVRLLALHGPQEVEGHDAGPTAERREELRRDARELVAVLHEDREDLVVPAQPRHHAAVEEELDETRRDRGALCPAPGVNVVLHGDARGAPAEEQEGEPHRRASGAQFRARLRSRGCQPPVPAPWTHAVQRHAVEEPPVVAHIGALAACPVEPQVHVPA
mmetsp:Transcript_104293/g.324269  ORF Transcript_104293/g.324269 Transcript_104293/m.324269 type:complete len:524 (-) Transcript_104293:94-1665(-)